MDMGELYVNPIVVAACLSIGKVIKSTPIFKNISNNLIPFTLLIVGIIAGVLTEGFTGAAILTGIISAVSAIGIHQTGKATINGVNNLDDAILEEEENKDEECLDDEDDIENEETDINKKEDI